MKILSINIEFGGYYLFEHCKSYGFIEAYGDLIRKQHIDVVCFQECMFLGEKSFDTSKKLAKQLGWFHIGHPKHYLSMISKFPLKRIGGGRGSVHPFLACMFTDDHGKVWRVANLHCNDQPFTYYSLIGLPYPNTPPDLTPKKAATLSYESKEDDLNATLRSMRSRSKRVIICGDFNEPSHLDQDIPWKCSRELARRGFIDTIRDKHPDPRRFPMFTCDVQRKETETNPPLRIDFMYAKSKPKHVDYLRELKWKGQYLSDHLPIVAEFS